MVNVSLFEPVVQNIHSIVGIIQLLVGGLFGIYIISFLYNLFSSRRQRKLMQGILREIEAVRKRLASLEKKLK
ncbi:MAG: hypothetical protein ABIF10_00635 [Candidatus Woesearchaeota archaeon]